MSHGVAAQFASVINHRENVPFLRHGKNLPAFSSDPIRRVQKPPSVAGSGECLAVNRWHPAQREICKWYHGQIEDDYAYRLFTLPAKHLELLGEQTSMGTRFEMLGGDPKQVQCEVIISGDTGVTGTQTGITAARLATEYAAGKSERSLLVLHVGTMEKCENGRDLKREDEHLGLMGVVEVLDELVKKRKQAPEFLPKAVALSEWGYEFGRLGLNGRTRFAELVVEELRRRGCRRFFAAVKGTGPVVGRIPIIPGDIELRFRLPELDVWCMDGSRGSWHPANEVRAEERCPEIVYHFLP
jgi:hypothetical protein